MLNLINQLLLIKDNNTDSILNTNLLNLIELNNISQKQWISFSNSAFTSNDQAIFDTILYNYLDIISSNKNLNKIKNYENEFNIPSSTFFHKWIKGEFELSTKTHDWAMLYKNIKDKWQEEKTS